MPETPQTEERIIIGGENEGSPVRSSPSRISSEVLLKFDGKSREVRLPFNLSIAVLVSSALISPTLNSF